MKSIVAITMDVMQDSALLDFAGYAYPVEGLGPGRRLAAWVRGCPLACPGCMTPELWESGPREQRRKVAEIAAELLPKMALADGFTISGGEPMEQPEALLELLRRLRLELPELEVLVYSGYTLEELHAKSEPTRALLTEIDILIDRRYVENAPNTLQWRGSDNQRVHLLSARAHRWAGIQDQPMPHPRPLAIQPLEAGRHRLIGIPKRGDFERYRAAMRERHVWIEPAGRAER